MTLRLYYEGQLRAAAASSTSFVNMLGQLGQPLGSEPLRYLRSRTAHYGIATTHFVEEPLPERPKQRYTEELLREAAERCDSLRGVIDYLGIPRYGSLYSLLSRKFEQFGIDTSHFTRRISGFTVGEERLRTAVSRAKSIAGVIRELGLSDDTSTRKGVRAAIDGYGLSTVHFTAQAHNRGTVSPQRKPADEILRVLPPGARRTRREQLHRALQEKRVPYQCQTCGLGDRWQGRTLVLEIDHSNGDRLDNRLGNLRYLCPSCHSQTDSFAHARRVPAQAGPRKRPPAG